MLRRSDDKAGALFARLAKLTRRREDFVTECFAAVLQADGRAADSYWRILSSSLPESIRTVTGPLGVRTQITASTGNSRLDMLVTRGLFLIGVEHKIFAPQGDTQLPKYLSLPRVDISHIALVTGDYQSVADSVLESRKYVQPGGNAQHFLWSDFYALIEASEARGYEVAKATRILFDNLGLQPAHPLIGDLRTVDLERRLQLDKKLKRALLPLIDSLRKRKWGWVGSSIRNDRQSEIYVLDGPSDLLTEVWLSPMRSPSSLCVRLKTTSVIKRSRILESLLHSGIGPQSGWMSVEPVRLQNSARGNHWAVDIRAPWKRLLKRVSSRASLETALERFVVGVMRAADQAAV